MKPKSKTRAHKRSKKTGKKKPVRKRASSSSGNLSKLQTIEAKQGVAGEVSLASLPRLGKPFLIIGVGASSGGQEAFGQLLKLLPANTGMAFIFIDHQSPAEKNWLATVFSRKTKMPVVTITSGTQVEPNRLYVLPHGATLTISNGVLYSSGRKRGENRHHSIDVFFSSLAQDQGNRAVGIALSGAGSDGASGMKEIKAEGGITFAQEPSSSTFPSMPTAAINTGSVDFVLSPENMVQELERLGNSPVFAQFPSLKAEQSPLKETDLHRIFTLLRVLTGVDFSYYKHSTLKRRIMRRMVLKKISHLGEYGAFLQQNPAEADGLFQDLLINVTSFFRDPPAFQALKKRIFPKIVKNNDGESVRVWVPGCSTGEEVYSLAMSLFEFLGPRTHSRAIQIFATDISETALAKARVGIYSESITANVSAERLRRFFHKIDGGYQIAKFIRESCVFARQNLIEDPPFSRLDLISCRNVLIYLGPLLQKKVIPIFHYALKQSGHLMLGTSETIGLFSNLFEITDKRNKIYIRREVYSRPEVEFLAKPAVAEAMEMPKMKVAHEGEEGSLDLHRQADRLLLAHYAPSGVIINSKLEVLQFRGQTGAYLEHSPGDASLNLLKLLRQPLLVDVRTAISRSMKADAPYRKEHVVFAFEGKTREVNIEVIPFRNNPSTERFFMILFIEIPISSIPEARQMKRLSKGARTEGAHREIHRLDEELRSTKESLQAIIEEQEATNEELKSANEEIQSSNEELQSTNEELETAKEELQSTNEELTTLNEELQNRNLELSQLNNDLSNLLSSVSMPILMLGNDLTIRRFTPMGERFFNLIPTDVGRRISDINPNILISGLDKLVSEVIDTLKIQEYEVQDREGRWYSLRIRPYRTTENKIDGAVILLVDIDEIKRALDEFMALVRQPLLALKGDMTIIRANEAFYQTFKMTREETENNPIFELGNKQWNIPALRNLLEAVLPEKNRIEAFEIEHQFSKIGRRKMLFSARRLYQQSKGTQLTLIAIEDVSQKGRKG